MLEIGLVRLKSSKPNKMKTIIYKIKDNIVNIPPEKV